MAFFVVTPEDAGHPGPGGGDPALLVFDTWLGDDLVRAHPVFLVTTRLKDTLEALSGPSGFTCARIRVERSRFLRSQRPALRLPAFWVLEISGAPGVHPLGLALDGSLVVSQAALDCLVQHSIPHAQLSQFVPGGDARASWLPGAEDGAAEPADEAGEPRP
jgi:hypothetical protein